MLRLRKDVVLVKCRVKNDLKYETERVYFVKI